MNYCRSSRYTFWITHQYVLLSFLSVSTSSSMYCIWSRFKFYLPYAYKVFPFENVAICILLRYLLDKVHHGHREGLVGQTIWLFYPQLIMIKTSYILGPSKKKFKQLQQPKRLTYMILALNESMKIFFGQLHRFSLFHWTCLASLCPSRYAS